MANTQKKRKKLFVLFLSADNPLAYIIKGVTMAPYNHSLLALDSKLKVLYTYDLDMRNYNNTPYLRNGFVLEGLNRFGNNTTYWLYSFNATDKQYKKITSIIQNLIDNQEKTSYNIKGALGFVFPPIWDNMKKTDKYSFTCSEFVAYVLQTSGVASFNKPLYKVSPGDLARLKELRFVKKGKIGDLINELYGNDFNYGWYGYGYHN